MSELNKVKKAMGPGPATYPKGNLERVPGKQNWVDRAGGLPRYIERIASHIHYEKGKSIGHSIAIAVNAAKKMCGTGDLNFKGKQNVNSGSRAAACQAVAQWERKKAQARVSKEGTGGTKWSDERMIAFLTNDVGITSIKKCSDDGGDCCDECKTKKKKRKKAAPVEKRGFNKNQPRSRENGRWVKTGAGAKKKIVDAVDRATKPEPKDKTAYPKLALRLARATGKKEKPKPEPKKKVTPKAKSKPTYEPYVPPKTKKKTAAPKKKTRSSDYEEQMERVRRIQEQDRKNREEAQPKKKTRDRSGRGLGPNEPKAPTDRKPKKGDPVPGKPGVTDGGYDKEGHKLPDSDGIIRLRRGDSARVSKMSDEEFDALVEEIDADAFGVDVEFDAVGEIEKSDDDKRLVFGWCSIAKHKDGTVEVDKQGDVLEDIDQMEKVAYDFVLHSRDGGEMHVRKGVSTLVESFVSTPEKWEAMEIPPGTLPIGWWVGFKVHDEEVWKGVKSGKYKMFSVHGSGMRKALDDA